MKSAISILLISCIIFFSCKKPKVYSDIPLIKYENFRFVDSLGSIIGVLTFSFTDGDGDIGLTQPITSDSLAPPPPDSTYYDLFITMFSKTNGIYDTVKFPTPFYYRLPFYESIGQYKTAQGRIFIQLFYLKPFSWDTVRYKFYIFDRAMHRSNTVTSPDIIFK